MSNHVADSCEAPITQLRVTPAHLAGSSYGAYIALALAVEHPELVRSLVLSAEPPVFAAPRPHVSGRDLAQLWIRRAIIEPWPAAIQGRSLEHGAANFLAGRLWEPLEPR